MKPAVRWVAAMGLTGLLAITGSLTPAFGQGGSGNGNRAGAFPNQNALVPNRTPAMISAERSRYFTNQAERSTRFGHDLDNGVGESVDTSDPLDFPIRNDVIAPKPGQSVTAYLDSRETEMRPDVGDIRWNPGVENLKQTAPVIRPFTAQWYRQHPRAWQYGYPGDNAWVTGTADRLSRWLDTTVAGAGRSVVQPVAAVESDGSQLQQTGSWMNVGVYSLAPDSAKTAERMVQLAVNPAGDVRGTHYDLISDEAVHVQGSVDKNNKLIVWSVGDHGQMIFQANLEQLLGSQAPVEAHFANGQTNRWTATKVQPPPNARD